MARVSSGFLPANSQLYLTLDRYQEIMRLPIAAFNGLNKPEETPQFECSTIWKQSDRDYVAQSLMSAEEMREQELGYPLAPKYFVEEQEYGHPITLLNKHLIQIGERKYADVSLAAALTLSAGGVINDPVTLTIATTLTDASEIHVYYPGESVEIKPYSVVISGGTLTIKLHRSRLVDPALLDDRDDHLYYNDDANFIATVDVKRVYYDVATGADYVWDLAECGLTLNQQIVEATQTAYTNIRDNRLAIVDTLPAVYSAGNWTQASFSQNKLPRWIRVRYLAGRQTSMMTEMQTARLAHTLMPNKPCSCPTVHQYWQEDTTKGDILTPYGQRQGAIDAWLTDSRQKIGQGGKIPAMNPRMLWR